MSHPSAGSSTPTKHRAREPPLFALFHRRSQAGGSGAHAGRAAVDSDRGGGRGRDAARGALDRQQGNVRRPGNARGQQRAGRIGLRTGKDADEVGVCCVGPERGGSERRHSRALSLAFSGSSSCKRTRTGTAQVSWCTGSGAPRMWCAWATRPLWCAPPSPPGSCCPGTARRACCPRRHSRPPSCPRVARWRWSGRRRWQAEVMVGGTTTTRQRLVAESAEALEAEMVAALPQASREARRRVFDVGA